MYTRDGLKPEVTALLELLRSQRPPDRVLDYREQRAMGEAMDAFFNLAAPAVAVEREIVVPGPGGEMRALVFAPRAEAPLPVVLHLHGGGYVFQSPRTYATMWKTVANAVPAVVVSLDYRMAPEHPYPAAVDDAAAAVRWLRVHADEIGGDGTRIALVGESAGGGLAPATALRLAADADAADAVRVRGVAIHTPWLDLTMSSQSIKDLGPDDPMLDSEMLAYWRDMYVPEEATRRAPQASPVFADLSSFPPAFVAAGGIDPLCAEGEQFGRALADAGRDVEFKRYDGMPHIFPAWPQLASLPEVVDVRERTVAFLRRVLGSS